MIGISTDQNSSAHDALVKNEQKLADSMAKLSSGSQFSGSDVDAADLSLSDQMSAQISGLGQAQQNVQDGISMVQTMGAGLGQVNSILQQISSLAVQYNNGTMNAQDQAAITAQVAQLSAEIDQIQGQGSFNGISLYGGTTTTPITLQSGTDQGDTTSLSTVALGSALGSSVADFATLAAGGSPSIAGLQGAISSVASSAASLGGVQNELGDGLDSLADSQENLMSANSQISDVDFAQETTNMAQSQILTQSNIAMMAQANQNSASVLRLLG